MPEKLSNALTSLPVKNAKSGRHADGAGLHLLVKPSGARSWVYRFMLNGKSGDIGLGAAGQGALSLAGDRDEAAALRSKVGRSHSGGDKQHSSLNAKVMTRSIT